MDEAEQIRHAVYYDDYEEEGEHKKSVSQLQKEIHVPTLASPLLVEDNEQVPYSVPECDEFHDGAVDFKMENQRLASEVNELKTKLGELQVRTGGSRISRNKKFDDAKCFNCESPEHFTNECNLQCFIR